MYVPAEDGVCDRAAVFPMVVVPSRFQDRAVIAEPLAFSVAVRVNV